MIHENAEGGFAEFETCKLLAGVLESFGVNEAIMKRCAKTGLYVDLMGTGPPDINLDGHERDGPKLVALRTELDALPMPENNHDLPYKSKTKFAHMCGHD